MPAAASKTTTAAIPTAFLRFLGLAGTEAGTGASGAGEWQISAGGAELSAVLPGASSIRLCTASGAEPASRSGGQAEFAAPGRGVYLLIGEMPDGRRRVAKILL